MSQAARAIPTPDQTTEAMAGLLAELSQSARHGSWAILNDSYHPSPWLELDQAITGAIRARANKSIDELQMLNTFISVETVWFLKKKDATGEKRQVFEQFEQELDRWGDSWTVLASKHDIARHLHSAVVWHSIWHLVQAGYHPYEIWPLIHGRSVRVEAIARFALSSLPIRPVERLLGLTPPETTSYPAPSPVVYQRSVRPMLPAISPSEPVDGIGTLQPVRNLDSNRLDGSIAGTWLALVGLSWVSLIWGALISAPFGVGLVIASSALAGIVAVPLWASVWGFFGMRAASDATMGELGFKPLSKDHPLSYQNEAFAAALGIRPPAIGTIGVCNALAMGMSRDNATVAIGKPLLQALSQREVSAVLGHELGHVVSGDMRRMMLMRTFQNATVWFMMSQGFKQFARWIICWGAELYILASSRNREYIADAIGAALAGKDAMIGALQKLEKAPVLTQAENTHARFMFRGRFKGMFSTHPSIADRVKALENETYIRQLPFR